MSKCSSRLIISVLTLLGFSLPASAHPMGNFSINHYSRLEISQTAMSIHAVLDYAEIPTFQLFDDWQIQTAGAAASPDLQRRVENLVESLRPHFRLLLDLIAPDLTLSNIREEVSPGAGNLPVLRVSFDLSAPWTPCLSRACNSSMRRIASASGGKRSCWPPPAASSFHKATDSR